MARPTNAELEGKNFFRSQCQTIETYLNNMEKICQKPNVEQKEDLTGTIGLLVGKIMVNFMFLERELDKQYHIFED